jgi:hypothetical protein
LAATVITISRKIQRIIQQDRNSRLGGLCKKLDMGKRCVRFNRVKGFASRGGTARLRMERRDAGDIDGLSREGE